VAEQYVARLAGPGIDEGLIGPRERDRLWDRHVLNCAVLTDLLPLNARVVDVGSGAGLPGLALACRRPDLSIDLVESLQRRARFLTETVSALGFGDRVRVVRGRAEDPEVVEAVGAARWVTARAVAALDRLAGWCLPLLESGGTLLAIKGERAATEILEFSSAVRRLGGSQPELVTCGADVLSTPVTVIAIVRQSTGGELASRSVPGKKPGVDRHQAGKQRRVAKRT
jgi:16S rRNA (guanine527-N7)-methyltransferase